MSSIADSFITEQPGPMPEFSGFVGNNRNAVETYKKFEMNMTHSENSVQLGPTKYIGRRSELPLSESGS
ncbi:hypothetical protein K0M31_002089 [Melipona bicolor]|uniref:Uncharacterized protein n=1 Tax=Melipona bicolor TaxID=60889 RepID=A0AA40KYB0_9HYME|nr:hypothetical protein K0M31_002089 [Melipona bicolor]